MKRILVLFFCIPLLGKAQIHKENKNWILIQTEIRDYPDDYHSFIVPVPEKYSEDTVCLWSLLSNEQELLSLINDFSSRVYFVRDYIIVGADSIQLGEIMADEFHNLSIRMPKVCYESNETILKLSFLQLSVVYDELIHMHSSPKFTYENQSITFNLEKNNRMNALIEFKCIPTNPHR